MVRLNKIQRFISESIPINMIIRRDMKDLADWCLERRTAFIKKALLRKQNDKHVSDDSKDEEDEEDEDEEYRHLVVIIADFDFFPTNVIQDLVSICSTHQSNLRY